MCTIERNGESKLEQKVPTPASWDNGIKTDVAVVVFYLQWSILNYHAAFQNLLKLISTGSFRGILSTLNNF